MRVLHVTDFFPPVRGGLEGHVDDLAGAQAALGHDVHVATMTPDADASHPDVDVHVVRAAAARVLPHADPERPFHPPLPDPLARRQLGALIERVRPDVVHGHTWLAVSVPRHDGVDVITAHDFALVCQLHTLLRTDGVVCGGPGVRCVPCGAGRYGWPVSSLLAPGTVVGRHLLRADRVITLSEHVARTLRPYLRVPIDVCGGLLPTVRPVLAPELPHAPFVLFAGDPSAHKGVDVLFEAALDARLRDVPLVVASTKAFDRPLPAGARVVHLDRSEMQAAWASAAVAVVPSVWPEPYGMVAMEALAAGTPVIASAIGALGEVVRDGIDGQLVPPGDARALADAIVELLAADDRRAEMGRAAAEGAARFRPATVAARVLEVYERAAA